MSMIKNTQIMTARDLKGLGLDCVAYVKRINVMDEHAYSIHAADGTEIGIMSNRDNALATIRGHNMEVVSAH